MPLSLSVMAIMLISRSFVFTMPCWQASGWQAVHVFESTSLLGQGSLPVPWVSLKCFLLARCHTYVGLSPWRCLRLQRKREKGRQFASTHYDHFAFASLRIDDWKHSKDRLAMERGNRFHHPYRRTSCFATKDSQVGRVIAADSESQGDKSRKISQQHKCWVAATK